MHQFFVDREQIGTEYITITGEDVKHIKNVLRMKEGEEVVSVTVPVETSFVR